MSCLQERIRPQVSKTPKRESKLGLHFALFTEAPKFENLYYTGSYSIEEGSGQLNVENTISLSSDYDDYSSVEVTLNGGIVAFTLEANILIKEYSKF